MFSLFIRNYIGTLLGIIFFGVMFFSNLDMIYQSESILNNFGIPHFVGWFLPLILFLYLSLFFFFQNRLLFEYKHAKRSLKHLFLIVSILYGFTFIGTTGFLISGFDIAIYWMFVTGFLAIKNFYYFRKIQKNEYLKKIKLKLFFQYLSIYGIIITLFLGIYARPISNLDVPKDYFTLNIINSISKEDPIQEIFSDISITQYLSKIASKKYKNADYDIIIYNFSETTLTEIENIYSQSKNFPKLNRNINYGYKKVLQVQKINLLKFEYEMLHEKYSEAISTYKNILKINESIRNLDSNLINYFIFIDLQNNTITRLEKYILQLPSENKEILLKELQDINVTNFWKKILVSEFSYRLNSLRLFYNIPLLIDKKEIFQVYLYTEYLKSENKGKTKNINSFKHITRKNYLGIYLIEGPIINFDYQYKKLEETAKKVEKIKNTLN